jgi:hypothetical protein
VSQSQLVTVHETDQFGRPMRVGAMRLAVLDPSLASIEPLADRGSSPPETAHANVVGLSGGLARIEASAAGWRADTAYVTIGNKPLTLLQDGFERELARNIWKELGLPAPVVQAGGGKNRSSGLVAWSDTEWESGILSSSVFPVRSGLRVEAWVHAPFNTAANGGTSFDIALVAADPEGVPDSVAPQFLRLVAASWIGEAGRMRYGVDREIFTEPATHISPTEWHNIVFEVGPNERVAFFLDGALRWTSTLKVRVSGDNSRAQLWLGSHDAGSSVVFDDVAVKLTPEPAPRR